MNFRISIIGRRETERRREPKCAAKWEKPVGDPCPVCSTGCGFCGLDVAKDHDSPAACGYSRQASADKRVPLRGTRDEWDQAAENLNLMLDRMEALMAEVKQVTDNVAHDLRTPLARMRGRLEYAYNRQRASDEDQTVIGETIADLDSVLRVFSSLMRITQVEAADRKAAFRIVDLGVELAGSLDFAGSSARPRKSGCGGAVRERIDAIPSVRETV